jgi:signal transduction histidine kinase
MIMPIDPERIHSERYVRIAEVILNSTEKITRDWFVRTRAEAPQMASADSQRLAERVHSFLNSLAKQLSSCKPSASQPQQRATRLGKLRWEQGENISQVVRDLQVLRLVLLEVLDLDLEQPLTRNETLALSLNIDEAIDSAVSAFAHQETLDRDAYARELEQSNRDLRRFAHVVAHELKAPLSAQSVATHLLELQLGDDQRDEDILSTLEAARDAIGQMESMINELLSYAEVGAGKREAQPVDCQEVYEQVRKNLKTEIFRNNASITCEKLPTVLATEASVLLLFQNLIGNAIHYCPHRKPNIRITANAENGHYRISVCDNGVGIEKADLTRVFDIFERAHADLRPRGTGIGLALCQRVTQELGGSIWAESQPGVGSVFHFTLPRADQMGSIRQQNESDQSEVATSQ